MYAAHAYDGEEIKENRIYVAPPDHHLLVEGSKLRIAKGPKENRFRPAIDPLFRSAAFYYGKQVIGIVLSGALDDRTAGLWMIKDRGGIAIVQDPMDAQVRSMPENAARHVAINYSVPVGEMARLLVKLIKEAMPASPKRSIEQDKKTDLEIRIAADETDIEPEVLSLGKLTPFTCPECHGVLTVIAEGDIKRYRCHTGHAYSADSLLAAMTEHIEEILWSAVRNIKETTMLMNTIGDHFAEHNNSKLAGLYFKKAKEAAERAKAVRNVILIQEPMSKDKLWQDAEESEKNR